MKRAPRKAKAKPREARKAATARKPQPKPKHLTSTQMRCKHPGCKQRSKGPRFSFLCVTHLPKQQRPNLRVVRGGKDRSKVKEKAPKAAAA
jgi:hypothetical protein